MVQLPIVTQGESFDEDGNLIKWVRAQYDNRTVTTRDTYDDNNQKIQTETETATTTQLGVDGSAHVTTVTDTEDLLTGDQTHQVEEEEQSAHGPDDVDFPTHRTSEATTKDSSGQTTGTRREVFDRDADGNTSLVTSESDTTGLTTVVSSKFDPDGNGVQVTDILDADGHLITQDDDVIGHPDLDSPFFSSGPFSDDDPEQGAAPGPGNTGRPGNVVGTGEPGQTETGGDLVAVVVGGGETGDEGEPGQTETGGDLVAVVVGDGNDIDEVQTIDDIIDEADDQDR
jgi:hypothetical protein